MVSKSPSRSYGEGSMYRSDYTLSGSGVTVERWVEIRLDRDTLDVVGCGPLAQRCSDPLSQHHHSDHQLEDCAGVSHEAPTAADASTNAQGHVASCRLNGSVLKSLECSGQEPRTTDQQDIRTVHESSSVPMLGHSSSLSISQPRPGPHITPSRVINQVQRKASALAPSQPIGAVTVEEREAVTAASAQGTHGG